MDSHIKRRRPVRAFFYTIAPVIIAAVALINTVPSTHAYGSQCTSRPNPGFSDQFTCSFVRISLGDPSLPGGFVFTGGFWLTLFLFAIPVVGAALLTRRAYNRAGIKE